MMIRLDQITRNPGQPRETFPQEHIERLADSIRARGLIQPITLRKIAADRYMIVAGECRFRAHQLLGAEEIRAEIVEIDDREMALRAIVENLQRHDMNPIEEAKAFKALTDQGFDPQRIVNELGLKSTALVTQRLSLLNLTPQVQSLVASGQLPATMAWGVALLPSFRQIDMVRAISAGKFKTSEQVKHACIALRDAEQQLDAFGELPKASEIELAVVSRLERKISLMADMVVAGFRDGECVAAQRVAPDRLNTMADKLVLVRKHVLQMEHDLRRVATTTDLITSTRGTDAENPSHKATVGVTDRQRPKGRREPYLEDELPRATPRSRLKARR